LFIYQKSNNQNSKRERPLPSQMVGSTLDLIVLKISVCG